MIFDAFVYYTHYDLPLGDRICQLLEESGLKCWNDKRDTHGFEKTAEVLSSSKSFVIIGNNDGASTYRFHLIREILQLKRQQPIFLVCAKGTENMLKDGRYFPDRDYGIDTVPHYYSYEDKSYENEHKNNFSFTDFDSLENILWEQSNISASKFDSLKFRHYIENVMKREINAVVLSECPRVFISHSHSDNKEAEKVYNELTSYGIQCWIDTKDIPAGASYPDAIIKGLEWCNCLVLIYSKNVMNSNDIPNELEVAHTDHKLIIPFLIDDSEIVKGYRYYLPRKQWIDAGPHSHMSMELSINRLKSELFRNMPQRNSVSDCSEQVVTEEKYDIASKVCGFFSRLFKKG